MRLVCFTEFVLEHTGGVKIVSKNEALRVRRRANYEGNIVVYVGMGLDFHQILYRQILRVKDRTAFLWVVISCHQSAYLSDKKDSKTI